MKIEAQKRTVTGKKVKNLRKEGVVPASVYGPKRPSINLQIDKKSFISLFKEVGFNKFFDLAIEGENKNSKVLVKEIQKNPLTDILTTVSFYQVDEDTKITVEVPVEFVGEAPAVKLNLGFLIPQMESIELHCYPKDLPSVITVDISKLENPGDGITVSDITLPKDVELSSAMDPSSSIVSIAAPQKEEEVVAPVAEEGAEGTGEAGEATPEGEKAAE